MAGAAVLAAALGGCARRAVEPVSHASGAVGCPSVALTVATDADLGEILGVAAVTAGGPISDGGGPVSYFWTASAGVFTDPGARTTSFRCPQPDPAGPETLTVTATRGPCTVTQQVVVICAAAGLDDGTGGGGGFGTGGGGGPGPDAGAGGDSDAEPCEAGAGSDAAHAADAPGGDGATVPLTCDQNGDFTSDEGNPCNRCTLDNCTTVESARPGVAPTAGCHQYASDAQRQRCLALYCCLRANRCVNDGDPTTCLCGDTDPIECAQGTQPARGPCLAELKAAAGTTDVSQIVSTMIDPALPVGGAINLATCRATYCATECLGFL